MFRFKKREEESGTKDIARSLFSFIALDKRYMAIMFTILALLKVFNLVTISDFAVLSYTIAGVLFSAASTSPSVRSEKALYFGGLLCIIVLPYANDTLAKFFPWDSTVMALFGVSFIFLAFSKTELDRYNKFLSKFVAKRDEADNQLLELVQVLSDKVIDVQAKHTELLEKLEELKLQEKNIDTQTDKPNN